MGNEWNEEGRFHTGPVVIYIDNREGVNHRFDYSGFAINSIDDLACRLIQRNVQSLVEAHRAAGFIITVENHPKQPFAMGHTEPRVEVRKVNSRPPEPEPNDYGKMATEAMARIKNHIDLAASDLSIVSAYAHSKAMDAMHNRHWCYIKAHRARCAQFIRLSPAIWTGDETPSELFKLIMRQKYFAGGLVK